jgi:iron complex transport system permease protein
MSASFPAHATRHNWRLSSLLALAILLAFACAIGLGSTPLPLDRIVRAALGLGSPGDTLVVWSIRVPRALAALITGAALGMCGAAMQGLLRNPLAEPGVLGVSASASLFATFTIFFGLAQQWIWALPMASVAGALLATLALAWVAGRVASVVGLILIGVGLSSFAGALMSLAMNFAPTPFSLSDLINWMLGSVANRSFADIGFSAPFIGVGLAVLWLNRRGLSALTLGEEAAQAVGLDLGRLRLAMVLGTGLAVGGSVALSGSIGFVGLIAAHLVRPWVGHDPGRTLLPAALMGGLIVLCADCVVRLAPTDNELKLGVVAALIGAPVFVWIAARRASGWGQGHG